MIFKTSQLPQSLFKAAAHPRDSSLVLIYDLNIQSARKNNVFCRTGTLGGTSGAAAGGHHGAGEEAGQGTAPEQQEEAQEAVEKT